MSHFEWYVLSNVRAYFAYRCIFSAQLTDGISSSRLFFVQLKMQRKVLEDESWFSW